MFIGQQRFLTCHFVNFFLVCLFTSKSPRVVSSLFDSFTLSVSVSLQLLHISAYRFIFFFYATVFQGLKNLNLILKNWYINKDEIIVLKMCLYYWLYLLRDNKFYSFKTLIEVKNKSLNWFHFVWFQVIPVINRAQIINNAWNLAKYDTSRLFFLNISE